MTIRRNPFLDFTSNPSINMRERVLEGSFQKGNRFECNIYPPRLLAVESSLTRKVSQRVKDVSMPDRTLRSVPNTNIYGPMHDIIQGQTYGALSVTFYLSQDMIERTYFEEWQKTTFDYQTYNINYYREYIGRMEIFALNEEDDRKYGVSVEEVFPDTIGNVAFTQDANNAANTCQIGFKFRYYRNIGYEVPSGEDPYKGREITDVS